MGSTAIEEDLKVPSWLNCEFLSDVLSKEEKLKIDVNEFAVKSVVGKGENYLSTLYRIIADCEGNKEDNGTNKSYLIVKTLPSGELIQKVLSELKGFEKELHMYEIVFPAIYNIMKSAFGKIHLLSARCFPCGKENILVLEDLQHLGYKMANRHNGLDLDHCKVTVKALARLHTTSIALYNKDPNIMEVFPEVFYSNKSESREKMEQHITWNMSTLASEVETWPGYEHYADRIRKIGSTAYDKMIEVVTPKKNSLNVLNHGDCWVNNMMFHYCPKTGKVDDVRFIDFQIARFSSPALDLQYFICNSPIDEVRYQHRETLLEEYYSELVKYMKALKMESHMITLDQLKEEFEEKDIFGLVTACTILCAVLAQHSDVPDLTEIKEDHIEKGGENPMAKTYKGKKYKEVFQKMLVFYDKKGLL